jgi:uncharacterized protein
MSSSTTTLFDYDSSLPLEAVSTLVEEHGKWNQYDLRYRVTQSSEYGQAWLIRPPSPHPSPSVVFLHGGAQDRSACIAEATLLADIGIASLLIDLPQARRLPDFSHPEEEQRALVETVIRIRRGLDYLASRPEMDRTRGAVVGFSFGGWIGSIIAAIDARVKTAVLVATAPSMTELWQFSPHPEIVSIRQTVSLDQMKRYAEATQAFNAIEYLRLCSNKRLFFQCGAEDEILAEEQRNQLLPFASDQNRLAVYPDASHLGIMLFSLGARRDRLDWLASELQNGVTPGAPSYA